MGFRERIAWAGRMALLLFVLASVAFLSAITTMRFAIQGREVRTPNLVGTALNQAQSQLRTLGLHARIEDRVYSDMPKDAVVRQSPPGGTQLKVGEWVHMVVSLGPQKVTIPRVSDRSIRAAQIELLTEGLEVGEISNAHLSEYPSDVVLAQSPLAGATDATSPHVDMLVSLGSRTVAYVMPDVRGLKLTDVQEMLARAGLKVDKVTSMPATGQPSGTVTSQIPPQGARVAPGDGIELEVAQ